MVCPKVRIVMRRSKLITAITIAALFGVATSTASAGSFGWTSLLRPPAGPPAQTSLIIDCPHSIREGIVDVPKGWSIMRAPSLLPFTELNLFSSNNKTVIDCIYGKGEGNEHSIVRFVDDGYSCIKVHTRGVECKWKNKIRIVPKK
jgi:hypothetical protein